MGGSHESRRVEDSFISCTSGDDDDDDDDASVTYSALQRALLR